MSEIGDKIVEFLTALMTVITAVVTPNWAALIGLLPLFIAPLVVLWFLSTTGAWTLVAITKRGPRLAPRDEAPAPAARAADGTPIYPAGRPYSASRAEVYPAGSVRDRQGLPLSLACPGCGAVRLAEISTCAGCGMEIRQRSVMQLERPSGPPAGGSANA